MDVVIIARNGLADRLLEMVRAAGSDAIIHGQWGPEVEARIQTGSPTLIIMEPGLRVRSRRLPDPSVKSRLAVAYLTPEGPREFWEEDDLIGFLPFAFDAGDIRTLMQAAREVLAVPLATPWSLSTVKQDRALLGIVGGVAVLLAGTIAYRLPGVAQWTESTAAAPYYIVAGLALLAAGCFVKLSRPLTGGAQFVVIATLAILSTE